MRHLVRLMDYTVQDVINIFHLASQIKNNQYSCNLKNKTFVTFFPESSIRTRVTFEAALYNLGAQVIKFPSTALDKREPIKDVIGYLNNWADGMIVRHPDIKLIDEMAYYAKVPVINAMTSVNHPCEVLSDLFSLSNLRTDYLLLKYLFVGPCGNIGLAWKEASLLMGFSLTQACPPTYIMQGVPTQEKLDLAIIDKDIILTDSLKKEDVASFKDYQVTLERMKKANKGALLNPCPPFNRGEEVSEDVIDSEYFVGYEFKKDLLAVQQAIILYNM